MEQKRFQFDFEIAFSNGGGLKGWDFRLDIDGGDISDGALADYIVRDLRLPRVGSVQVSNTGSVNAMPRGRAVGPLLAGQGRVRKIYVDT